jgi:Family of unknown function (DUF6174)
VRSTFSSLALVVGLLLGANHLSAQSDPGPVLGIGKIPSFDAYSLFASGSQGTNLVLQASADLRSWTNVFQAYAQPGIDLVLFLGQNFAVPQTFWRATVGEPLLEQERRWTNQEPVEYSFYLRHMISFWEGGVRGRVRVLNGKIAEVTNALDDKTLQPISNPDPSEFRTITELFEEIAQALKDGVEQIRVRWDPSGLYPERIEVDSVIGVADDESLFEASEFVVLQP